MKEEYKQYRKTVRKKHSIRFWDTPSYQEDLIISIKPEIAIYIFATVMEELEWGIGILQDDLMEGVRWNKKQRELEKISVVYKDPITIEIKSELKGNTITDWGVNYRNVKLLLHVYEKLTKGYTKEDYDRIALEIEKRNSWDDYLIPDALPSPYLYKEPSERKFYWGLTILYLPFMFSPGIMTILVSNPKVTYSIILIWLFIFGYPIKYLLRWSRFSNENSVERASHILGIIAIIVNMAIEYPLYFLKEKYHPFEFQDYIRMLPMVHFDWDSAITVGISSLVIGSILIWGLPLYIFVALFNFQNWKYPEEVVSFVYYFKVKKKKTNLFIKVELRKRGWEDERLQKELLEMHEENNL